MIVIGVLLFRSTFADWYQVSTGSMKPTIIEGDRVFVNKLAYEIRLPFSSITIAHWDDPARGDIVVFYSPHNDKRLIKRVIGPPGDVIAIRYNQLFINGVPARYAVLEKPLADLAREQGVQHYVLLKE